MDYEGGGLVECNFMVGQNFKNFLKMKARLTPWMFKKVFETFLPKLEAMAFYRFQAHVLPLLGGDNQGGYGVVHNV